MVRGRRHATRLDAMRIAIALVASALVLAACGEPAVQADASKGQIAADLKDHTITLSAKEVGAGTATVLVRNRGGSAHDFIVLRTDLAPDKLTVDQQTQKAGEEGRVDGLQELGPGKSGQLKLDLAPGRYVLICNVPTHYGLGMRTELTVR